MLEAPVLRRDLRAAKSAAARLEAEAREWVEGREPPTVNCFEIEQDGAAWRLRIIPKRGAPDCHEGLTEGEAYRMSRDLTDAGFIGRRVFKP